MYSSHIRQNNEGLCTIEHVEPHKTFVLFRVYYSIINRLYHYVITTMLCKQLWSCKTPLAFFSIELWQDLFSMRRENISVFICFMRKWFLFLGIPPLTGTATLTIGITDMSDEPPHLAEPTTHFVTENTDPNPSVFSISAEDRDRNPRFGAPFNFSLPCNNNCPCVDNPTCDSFSLQHDPSK